MRASLDFDGILTDHTQLDLAHVDQHTFFKSPRSAAAVGPRPGVRQLAALLSCFAEVAVLTARPPAHHPAIRRWLVQHVPEMRSCHIFSSGDRPKGAVAEELRIALHVDDDPMTSPGSPPTSDRVLLWRREDLTEILNATVDRLNSLIENGASTKIDDASQVHSIGVSSATPVFRVRLLSGRNLKIRVFDSAERAALVERFHREAPSGNDSVRVPEIVSSTPLAMTTPWIEGDMVREIDDEGRVALIPRVARFLAVLHARGEPDSGSDRLISCAMDAFNLCRTSDGIFHLIDAGDCTVGSRWLDVMWAEQLLCASHEEREWLVICYINESGVQPTAAEARDAAAEYYGYLHSILMTSKRVHAGSPTRWQRCDEIAERRRSPVKTSALLSHSRGAA